jgi:predicted nucleic acid-binding protein
VGSLTLPPSGLVYVDANPIIYSVEKHPVFGPLLQPLWQAAQAKSIEVGSSDLVLLEVLVGPLARGDAALEMAYDQALGGTDLRLLPVTQPILREAARLRAGTKLKTPDAIHAATASAAGSVLFVTNDAHFRGNVTMPLIILADLLTP